MNEDRHLWKRLRAGDADAFRAVVDTHYRSVYRQLWYLSGDCDLAADFTQETFIRAWKSIPTFAGRASMRSWLRTIAVRVWWRRVERSLKIPEPESLDGLAALSQEPSEAALAALDRDDLTRAVRRLPEIYRVVIVLRYLEEMSHSEIAVALGIPSGTVKSRLHEAMRRLRRMLVSVEGMKS